MTKELTVKNNQIQSASSFAEIAPVGLENLDMSDFSRPAIKLLQALSPEITEDTVPGAKAGLFYFPPTGKLYDSLTVVPCFIQRKAVEWRDKNQGGGFVQECNLNDDRVVKYGFDTMTPEGTSFVDTADYFVLLIDGQEIDTAVLSMTITKMKPARQWNDLMRQKVDIGGGKISQLPIFAFKYKITSVDQLSKKNNAKFKNIHIEKLEMLGGIDDPIVKQAMNFREFISENTVTVERDEL
jgi:hypothetical protein